MNKFRIRPEIYPYLEKLLSDDGVPCKKTGTGEIEVQLSGTKFHRYLKNAVCQKEQKDSCYPEIQVLSKEAIANPRALHKLLGKNGVFFPLQIEREGVLNRLESQDETYFISRAALEIILPKLPEIPGIMRYTELSGEPAGCYKGKEITIAKGIIQTQDQFCLV